MSDVAVIVITVLILVVWFGLSSEITAAKKEILAAIEKGQPRE